MQVRFKVPYLDYYVDRVSKALMISDSGPSQVTDVCQSVCLSAFFVLSGFSVNVYIQLAIG